MRIEVPVLPPPECSPNWRGHWSVRNREGKSYRESVFYHTHLAMSGRRVTSTQPGRPQHNGYSKATLQLTFIFPTKRKRDMDNLVAMFKPGLDGLRDVGAIADDNIEVLTILPPIVEVDAARAPMTIIELEGE